jgi:HAE1 family hydrophobic/amphiphilic exporter-1
MVMAGQFERFVDPLVVMLSIPVAVVGVVNLKRREEGLDVEPRSDQAGGSRLRPILMTTSTTVLRLLPLALGWGAGARLQSALARTVIGGPQLQEVTRAQQLAGLFFCP